MTIPASTEQAAVEVVRTMMDAEGLEASWAEVAATVDAERPVVEEATEFDLD